MINSYLHEAKSVEEDAEAIHLLFSSNRWFLAKTIRDDLAQGVILVVDRYSFSGIAYSLAKGLDKSWVCAPELGLPKPDIVLFLDIDSTITSMRSGFGDEALDKIDFQQNVYQHMKALCNESYWQVRYLTAFHYYNSILRRSTLMKQSKMCTKVSPVRSTRRCKRWQMARN